MSAYDDSELAAALVSDGRGRRASTPLAVEVVRTLEPSDLPLPPSQRADSSPTLVMRSQHHRIAQLLAKSVDQHEVALITGYTTAYISRLKGSPAFEELLAYYSTQREQVFIDVLERMKALGLATLEELQSRLADDPEGWTKRELLEMAELMLVKPMTATRALPVQQGAPAGVSVSVNFVSAGSPPEGRGGGTIDGTAIEVTSE